MAEAAADPAAHGKPSLQSDLKDDPLIVTGVDCECLFLKKLLCIFSVVTLAALIDVCSVLWWLLKASIVSRYFNELEA